MHHLASLVFLLWYFPQLLEPYRVVLRARFVVQSVLADELFTEMPSATFGEQRVATAQFIACLIRAFLLTFAIDAHIASSHAHHRVIFVENLRSSETRQDDNTFSLGLLAKPTTQVS